MSTSILVPLDGSPFGESVLSLAGDIAERMGSNLELVTVNPPDRHPDIPAGMIAEIASARGVGARLYLDTQAQELHRRFEVAVYTAVLDGPVSSAIAEHVRHDPAFSRGMTRICEGGGVALYKRTTGRNARLQ